MDTTLIAKQSTVQPVYSKYFFAAKRLEKAMKIDTKCEFFTHQETIITKKRTVS